MKKNNLHLESAVKIIRRTILGKDLNSYKNKMNHDVACEIVKKKGWDLHEKGKKNQPKPYYMVSVDICCNIWLLTSWLGIYILKSANIAAYIS